jgi:hypothetical protein
MRNEMIRQASVSLLGGTTYYKVGVAKRAIEALEQAESTRDMGENIDKALQNLAEVLDQDIIKDM